MKFDKHIAVSSRIRLARNFANVNFMSTLTNQEDIEYLQYSMQKEFDFLQDFSYFPLKNMPILRCNGFLQRHLISRELIENRDISAVISNEDENIVVMLFEEDHLRLQSISTGFDLMGAYHRLLPIDEMILSKFDIAFDEEFGFLTSSPANLGTGMRAGVMVFIPEIEKSGKIEELIDSAKNNGLTFRGVFGEGSNSKGGFFQISNQNSLGLCEEEIIDKVSDFYIEISRLEQGLRQKVFVNNYDEIKDQILRAFALLTSCHLLDENEMFSCLASIKLGEVYNFLKIKDEEMFSKLYYHASSISLNQQNQFKSLTQENKFRAEFVANRIKKLICLT